MAPAMRLQQPPMRPVQYEGATAKAGRMWSFHNTDSFATASIKMTLTFDYETREWSGKLFTRASYRSRWKQSAARPRVLAELRALLPPEEIAHITREALSWRAP